MERVGDLPALTKLLENLDDEGRRAFQAGMERRRRENLLDVPSLESCLATLTRVETAYRDAPTQGRRLALEQAQGRVAQALERDALQAERPEGCWCLGLGGRDRAAVPFQNGQVVDTFLRVCEACPEGRREGRRKARLSRIFHAEENREQERRLLRAWENTGVPARMRDWRLEFSPVFQAKPNLAEMLADLMGSWYFWGPVGRGKTGLAVGYAYAWLQCHRQPVCFVTVPDLLGLLRATYSRSRAQDEDRDAHQETEEEVIRRYAEVPLLVLDDLGAEQISGTGWVEDRLYRIIGLRHAERRPTVITANVGLEEIELRIGQRIMWRIYELCGQKHIIRLDGPNLRA